MSKKGEIDAVNALADKLPKTVSAVDSVLSTVVGVFDILLAPFQIAKIYKDAKLEEIKNNIIEKSKSIPEEDLKETADLSIVGPALEAMKYTIMNDDLNELFENLLVSSLDKKKNVFPGFVDIIKQLNSDEAKLLKYLAQHGETYPVISLRCEKKDGNGGLDIVNNYTNIGYGVCENPSLTTTYLVDLARFGLIEFAQGKYLIDDKLYEPLINHKDIKGIDNNVFNLKGFNDYHIVKSYFKITEYGKEFISACVNVTKNK